MPPCACWQPLEALEGKTFACTWLRGPDCTECCTVREPSGEGAVELYHSDENETYTAACWACPENLQAGAPFG